jgi:Subtilase family
MIDNFIHPVAGKSERVNRYLAVRWRPQAAPQARADLLRAAGVELATTNAKTQPPPLRVNQTEGLSWVQGAGGKPIPPDAPAKLEASELVEWVSPGFKGSKSGVEMFTVNPTRLYIKQAALDGMGGIAVLGTGVAMDTTRTSRLPGYIALSVDDASYDGGKTAIDVAGAATSAIVKRGTGSVATSSPFKYETIPFLSPACQVGRCRPPVTEFTPNDPMFAQQWGLQRTNVPRAWTIVRGSPQVTVAVIDEGVQLDHPDLDLHPQSWNASTDTPDGSPTDNHGTACAGIIGARLDNTEGVAGVAGGVQIMAIATATWADVDIAEGLYFAADNGARIVSMSFGVYPWYGWDFSLIQDALQHAHDKGLLLIAASGNENGAQARFPGSDARTLCVGGSNRSDERKRIGDASSEDDWGASYGPDLDVVAPCLEMPTTDRLGAVGYSAGDYHERFNGTSSATPLVAGIGALLFSLRPSLTSVEARYLIESSCDKISPNLYGYANVGTKPSGSWNNEVGYGRVNAERALLAACALDEEEEGECIGCGNGCADQTPGPCRGPSPVPWLTADRCLTFYEGRTFDAGLDRRLLVRIIYEHRLCLIGRQQGGLLYTTTLLPGEEVKIYEFDRFRRVKSDTERVSVHTSFRQTMSALSGSRRSSSSSAYTDILNDVRTNVDTSVSVGGGLGDIFGGPKVKVDSGIETQTTVASGASARTASEQFSQMAMTASQAMDAERSLVISRFEEAEHQNTTARSLKNDNHCFAVTYFVRRVNEVYETSTRVESIEWRFGDGPWRSLKDLAGAPDGIGRLLDELRRHLPRIGEVATDPRRITLPTDGTLYEAELARCSSCEPIREAEEQVKLEQLRLAARKKCLEIELLAMEVERRRALVASAQAPMLELTPWPFEPMALLPPMPDHKES